MLKSIKELYWNLPIVTDGKKEKFFYKLREIVRGKNSIDKVRKNFILEVYRDQVHRIPLGKSKDFFIGITRDVYTRKKMI